MSNIAIFVGKFDPPHADHQRILQWLISKSPMSLNQIYLLVDPDPAIGQLKERTRMVQKMAQRSASKSHMLGTSFTILDTSQCVVISEDRPVIDQIGDLVAIGSPGKVHIIIGADEVGHPRWEALEDPVTFEVIQRPGFEAPDAHDVGSKGFDSTSIRDQIAEGDFTYLTGDGAKIHPQTWAEIRSMRWTAGTDRGPCTREESMYGYKKPHIDPYCQTNFMDITLKEVMKFSPGQSFYLNGDITKVLRVTPSSTGGPNDAKSSIRFHVVRSHSSLVKTQKLMEAWHEANTRAWSEGKEYTDKKPTPVGPGICYLKQGEQVDKDLDLRRHLGTVGDLELFLTSAPPRIGGLFSCLF